MDDQFSTALVVDNSTAEHDELAALDAAGHVHIHDSVESYFHTSSIPLDMGRFSHFLTLMPSGVVRAKGVLFMDGEPRGEKKHIFQYVGGRALLTTKPWKEEEDRRSALVFIGRSFDPDALKDSLTLCEAK